MTAIEHYEDGWWSCSYVVSPVENPPSLQQFRNILGEIKGTETGWPPWLSLEGRPGMGMYIREGLIECTLSETDTRDFWRADPIGRMFLLRRYQEDYDFRNIPPGSFIDLILPIWRTGECLLHAYRLGERLGATRLDLTMTWTGLENRDLRAMAGDRILTPGRISHEGEVVSTIHTPIAVIQDALPELVRQLVSPLYARFDFFEPPAEIYSSELARMRGGRA